MDHAMMDQPLSFAEQLRDFLRRNMHWFLAAGFTLLLLQDVVGTHGLVAMRHAQKEAASVQKEIDQINEENRQLQDSVKALKTNPQAIERIAREEMGLARPGEYIFKTEPGPGDASSSTPDPTAQPKKP
jgi:cell division protein FtsB